MQIINQQTTFRYQESGFFLVQEPMANNKGEIDLKGLHIISTGQQTKDEFVKKASSIQKFVDYIHLREREWSATDHIEVIGRLIKAGLPLEKIIVNDRVDIAVMEQTGGVQLASHSLDIQKVKHFFPTMPIGCSVHDMAEAIEKEKCGADFLLFGHIFSTYSKPGLPPRGLKKLKCLISSVTIPVIAIGGIKPNNVSRILDTGAKGVAVLSGVLLEEDSLQAASEYREKLMAGKGGVEDDIIY